MSRTLKNIIGVAGRHSIAMSVDGANVSFIKIDRVFFSDISKAPTFYVSVNNEEQILNSIESDKFFYPTAMKMISSANGIFLGLLLSLVGLFIGLEGKVGNILLSTGTSFLIFPMFNKVKIIINDLISRLMFKDDFEEQFRLQGAINSVVNSYLELGRIPTLSEAKNYDSHQKINVDYLWAISYLEWIIFPIILIIAGDPNYGTHKLLFLIVLPINLLLAVLGKLDFLMQIKVLVPQEQDIALAIAALAIAIDYENNNSSLTESVIKNYLQNLSKIYQ